MTIITVTSKGQVVIPAGLRKRFNIHKGTRLAISEGEGSVILVRPVPDDPIGISRGMLKGKTSLVKALMRDRREEAKGG
jgi:AbrB family looped-hinge helix DNA binding protein